MIFAAGRGTRLGALGESTPKALLEVGGVTMIERVARCLIDAGADRLIINLHHHGDAIRRFVLAHDSFGVEVLFSPEPESPLETGGGLRQAAPLLRRDGPFLLHNVDVVTELDIRALLDAHAQADPLATLAVSAREATRYLMFDDAGLCGHADRTGRETFARAATGEVRRLGFTGVHAVSPALLDRLDHDRVFSIMTTYLRLAAEGERILPFDATGALWLDIGTPERLEAADRLLSDSRERRGG